ncbi:MAG: addiction module toxin RelE [Bacteroidetes bacterium]|nr:addiction module toxin RelE [Bacteroidota bacterium]
MKIDIITTSTFDKEYKRLKKKYRSLPSDLALFEEELLSNPESGTDLGSNVRKIRLAIKAKNKGKSGGARIITYTVIVSITSKTILLVTIYDKSEIDSITDAGIKQIIRDNGF